MARPAGKQLFKGHQEDPDGSQRKKKKDYERFQKGGRKRHFGLAQKALIWDIYKRVVVDGLPVAKVAEILEMSDSQCRVLLRKAKYALATSETFDAEAADIRKEMLKFLPLAGEALKENLMDAEPRVTVAYLQGVGALVNREEIDHVTDEDRKAQQERSIAAMNPKMKAALGIVEVPPDQVTITTAEDKEKPDTD